MESVIALPQALLTMQPRARDDLENQQHEMENVIALPQAILTMQPRARDDLENQTSQMPSNASTSILPSRGHLPPSSPQTQVSEYISDAPSSTTQLREREYEDPVPLFRPKPRKTGRPVGKPNSKSGLSTGEGEQHERNGKLSHAERKEQLHRALNPLMGHDSSTLLLCSGEQDRCRIIPVHIRDGVQPTAQWDEARRVWNHHNTTWKSWLPWFGVKSVAVVQVRIAGKTPGFKKIPKDSVTFIGLYRAEDTKAEISRLVDKDPYFFTDEYECLFNMSNGTWDHVSECLSVGRLPGPAYTCPYEGRRNDRKYLLRLQSRPLLHIWFWNPDLAAENASMDDLMLLISSWSLLEELERHYCPNFGDLSFPGLLIKEGWLLSRPRLTLSLFASGILFLSVVTAWLIYHDWAVAWQVGGCFLAFITFICGCIHTTL